jgi:hypothetical protein
MATNPFLNKQHPGEQALVESLSIEQIKMFGYDMIYVPREFIKEDKIFGEGKWYKFKDTFPIEMYIENVNGFEGQGDLISKFGLQVKDRVTLILAKKRFENEVTAIRNDIVRPREGDLIYFPFSNGLFEINFVEHENPFYFHGKLYTYKLTCELFNYDHSDMDTGVSEIDAIETENNTIPLVVRVQRIPGITNYGFYEGEVVNQYVERTGQVGGITGSILGAGTVITYNGISGTTAISTMVITMNDPYDNNSFIQGICGAPGSNSILMGANSGAKQYIYGISGSNIIIPRNPLLGENYGDNDVISLTSRNDNIINYCENNPFSEGSV